MNRHSKNNLKLKSLVLIMIYGWALGWSGSVIASNTVDPYMITTVEPYIINGQQAQVSGYPYMGLLNLKYTEQSKNFVVTFCGGTLLNEQYVLTAAHCVYVESQERKEELKHLEVSFNIDIITKDIFDDARGYAAESIYYPDSYNNRSFANDIAIIKLQEPVDSNLVSANDYIRLSPSENYRDTSFSFTLIGYGYTAPYTMVNGEGSNRANNLRKVTVDYLDTDNCQNSFKGIPISDKQLCATGDVIGDLRSGACQGDSGSPLLYSESNQVYQAGIVSFGPEICGDPDTKAQSVYTEVADYSGWIASVINGTEKPKLNIADIGSSKDLSEAEAEIETEPENDNSNGGLLGWYTVFLLSYICWKRRDKLQFKKKQIS